MFHRNIWLVVKVLDTNQNELVPSQKLLKCKKVLGVGDIVKFLNKKTSRLCLGTVLFISRSRRSAEKELINNYKGCLASTSTSLNSNGVSDSDRSQQYTSCECNKRFIRSDPTSHDRIPIIIRSTPCPYQDRNADIFNLKFDVATQTDPLPTYPELSSAETIDELKSAITSLMEKFNNFSVSGGKSHSAEHLS